MTATTTEVPEYLRRAAHVPLFVDYGPGCITRGCSRPTIYGGRCSHCDILFGSYEHLLAWPEVTEAEPLLDTEEPVTEEPDGGA